MGLDHQGGAVRWCCALLLGASASACSEHPPSGERSPPAQGVESPAASSAGGTTASASGAAGETSMASAGTSGGTPASDAAGGRAASTSGAAGETSVASAGASGGTPAVMDPLAAGTAGTSSEPPLVVNPVGTWGGKALDMVPYATSGTRLGAVGYADDGAVFFATMRDAELGTDCRFEQSEAGEWLCSPTKKQALIYLDAACTQPAAEEPPYGTPTGEVFGFQDNSVVSSGGSDTVLVSQHSPVYRVADAVFMSNATEFAEDTISIYTKSSSQCSGPRVANRHVVLTPPSIFRVTPVADAELVKATIRDVPLRDGLTLERLVTDDGAQLSGHLKLAGRECELQRDGRCVPVPVGQRYQYADPDCKEWAFELKNAADAGATLYGVDPTPEETAKVYELIPTSTLYSQKIRIDMVVIDGQPRPVEVIEGCEGADVSNLGKVYYRRARDVTEELPKLDTVQLGTASLSPIWFFGVLSASETRIQVQIHSPEGNWVRPNIRTSNGSACSVYDDRFENQCLMMDGLSSLPVTQVNL